MKKILSFIIILSLAFSLVGCSEADMEIINELIDQGLADEFLDHLINGDSQQQTAQQPHSDDYKVPIILLHGRDSNTEIFFGVENGLNKNVNSCYNPPSTNHYTSPISQKILSIKEGALGAYLVDELGYEPNKNLFAFNYPNGDMVFNNACLLSTYINNLIDMAKKNAPETADYVDGNILFPSQDNKQVKFILIGHSMGGLVSRYYIENLGGHPLVDKLITIDTPHYGSGIAYASGVAGSIFGAFLPCDVDLQPTSTLFCTESDTAITFENAAEEYGYKNQSPALNGNHDKGVKYYAICGYNASIDDGIVNEVFGDNLAEGLKTHLKNGGAFSISFDIDFDILKFKKQALKDRINSTLMSKSLDVFGESSTLDLGDGDGDNVVDYMSQLAVNFSGDTYQKIEEATMIIATGYTYSSDNHYHGKIYSQPLMHEAVAKYITAE